MIKAADHGTAGAIVVVEVAALSGSESKTELASDGRSKPRVIVRSVITTEVLTMIEGDSGTQIEAEVQVEAEAGAETGGSAEVRMETVAVGIGRVGVGVVADRGEE